MSETYKVIRFYQDIDRPAKVIMTGLTLDQAQAHCQREDTRGDGWFDGYEVESLPLWKRTSSSCTSPTM